MGIWRHAIPAAAALAVGVSPGLAGAQGVDPAQLVRAEVIPGWRTTDGTHMAALHLTLAEGWKTYWRSPGDSGFPPRFDWAGSENLAGVEAHWPRPDVFDTGGVRTIGFDRELVLPLEVTLTDEGGPARLVAMVDVGVCETVCVPVQLVLDAALPAAGGAADARILAALERRPAAAAEAGVGRVDCVLTPTDDGLRLTATLELPDQGAPEVAVLELPGGEVWISPTATRREGPLLIAEATLVALAGGTPSVDRAALRVTVLGDGRAVEVEGCPAP